ALLTVEFDESATVVPVSLIDATIYFFLVFLLLMKCRNPLVTVLCFRHEHRISLLFERHHVIDHGQPRIERIFPGNLMPSRETGKRHQRKPSFLLFYEHFFRLVSSR